MSTLVVTTNRADGHVHIDVAVPSPKLAAPPSPPDLPLPPDAASVARTHTNRSGRNSIYGVNAQEKRNGLVFQTDSDASLLMHTTTTEPDSDSATQKGTSTHQRTRSSFMQLPTPISPVPPSPLPSQLSNNGAAVKTYGHRSVSSMSSIPSKQLPLIRTPESPTNTLDAVRSRVAQGVAWRAINRAQTIDGIKVGVALTLTAASSARDAETTLGYVVHAIRDNLRVHNYLFAVAPAGPHAYRSSSSSAADDRNGFMSMPVSPADGPPNGSVKGVNMQRMSSYSGTLTSKTQSLSLTKSRKSGQKVMKEPPRWPLVLIGSSPGLVEKAATLTCAKFLGRLREIRAEGGDRWLGYIEDAYLTNEGIDGSWGSDEAMLWDVVRKTSHVLNPKTPPQGARSSAQILATARSRLERLTPQQALSELRSLTFALPVVIVDIRPLPLRQLHGEVPDSLIIARLDLEFRFDPRNVEERLSVADRFDLRVIVLDQDGRASSLAAAALHDIGLLNATDVIGGFEAWKKAGLPVYVQSERTSIWSS